MLQHQWAARQRRQPLPERRVHPLDVRRVDHTVTLSPTPERLNAYRCAIDDTAFDVDDPPLGIALHDLCDADIVLRAQPRAPPSTRLHRITKGLTNRADV
jgi:hypothetical protein